MAKGNLLGKLMGILSKAVSGVPSFMDGFDVRSSDVEVKSGGIFISNRQLVSTTINDVNGNPLTLNISIGTSNALTNEIIATAIKGIKNAENTLAYRSGNEDVTLAIEQLLGDPAVAEDKIDNGEYIDVYSKNATDPSLLNPVLDETASNLNAYSTYWKDIAFKLNYSLNMECPGFTPGKIENKSINDILSLISSYAKLSGAVEESVSASNAFQCNATYLVMPILLSIQNYLKEYLDSASDIIYGNESEDNGSEDNESEDEEDAADNMADQFDETFSDDFEPAGTKINIKLQKITATSDINLLGIQTDYAPGKALDVVDDILSNPDFTDLLTETPQTYEICVDDDGYDINPCDELIVHPEENLKQLFIQAIQFSRNLHMIHWLAIGNDMEKLHIKAEELYDELDEEIDLLAELIVEKTGTIVDINKIETWNTVGTQDRTFQQGIECIKQDAQSFIDYIDITYPNQPSDVQSILDDWLRYWNKQINYFIVREQEN